MAMKAICMLKVIRLQNPSPNDFTTTIAGAPFSNAAAATKTRAMAANT